MPNQAICGFCSRNEPRVQVLCEGRCLVCNRCLGIKSIKKLLVDKYYEGIAASRQQQPGHSFVIGGNPSIITDISAFEPSKVVGGVGNGNSVASNSHDKHKCPLCEQPMARNIIQTIEVR